MRLTRSVQAAAVAIAAAAALGLSACERRSASGAGEGPEVDPQERQRVQAEQQLASLGGPASREQRALYEGEFTASGTLEALGAGEGAWELRLLNDYAQFVRPGLGEDGGIAGARDYREQGMRVTAGPIIITIRAEECPLPTGEALPYSASVLFEGISYQGCAKRGVTLGDRPTWASVLDELLPAIDACLRRVEARPARVTTASILGEGQVGVRLRQSDGGRYGCVASADGSRVVAYDPLLDSDHLYGESDPEFLRAPGTPPRGSNCRSVTEVKGPAPPPPPPQENGETIQESEAPTLGWLVRRTC
jgi:hypothetical protein